MRRRKTSTVHEDTRRSCWTFIDSYSSYQLRQGTKSFLRGRENGRQGVTHKQEAAVVEAEGEFIALLLLLLLSLLFMRIIVSEEKE